MSGRFLGAASFCQKWPSRNELRPVIAPPPHRRGLVYDGESNSLLKALDSDSDQSDSDSSFLFGGIGKKIKEETGSKIVTFLFLNKRRSK